MSDESSNVTEAQESPHCEGASRPPRMVEVGGVLAPEAPSNLGDTAIEREVLTDMVLKLAYTVASFTTDAAADRLCLPPSMVAEMLENLRADKLVEILGEVGPYSYRFAITGRGRERALRLLEISGYVGPAPVSLDEYSAVLDWQLTHLPEVYPDQVAAAIADMVLPAETIEVAGLAGSSGRSLFLYGPPGNGKTSLGHLLHDALRGEIWIPYCVAIESNIIRLFDDRCHERVGMELSPGAVRMVDRRWVRIRRPFIVAAGEMTVEALDLAYSAARGYYEAPVHMKANGGTFLLDDFGCQRVEPRQLLNRWVFPLEHQVDYLTLQTGQKLRVPFRQMLIVSTNIDPAAVMDPAFLRRMGYRLYLGDPSPESYGQIFDRYAAQCGATVPAGLVASLLARYRAEGRPLRSCEPRDLIERARDICKFRRQPLELNEQILELAWKGYFGQWQAAS